MCTVYTGWLAHLGIMQGLPSKLPNGVLKLWLEYLGSLYLRNSASYCKNERNTYSPLASRYCSASPQWLWKFNCMGKGGFTLKAIPIFQADASRGQTLTDSWKMPMEGLYCKYESWIPIAHMQTPLIIILFIKIRYKSSRNIQTRKRPTGIAIKI